MPLEHLEDDQPHLDIQTERRAAIGKQLHQTTGCQRIAAHIHRLADQGAKAQGQMSQWQLIAGIGPPHHAIEGHCLLQLIGLDQTERVDIE